MEKEFVPYDESLELKTFGFDEPCVYYIDKDNNSYIYNFQTHPDEFIEGCGVNVIPTPTFSQAFRWFREKYNLEGYPICVRIDSKRLKAYQYVIISNNYQSFQQLGDYSTYEEAELACLKKLISIVKKNKL